jgi:hypothetical protein
MKLAVVLILCAASALAQEQSATSGIRSACGAFTESFDVVRDNSKHAIAQPEAGKALVYMIQDMGTANCPGACITTRVGLDGAWIGANQHNSYFSFSVEAGEHHLCVNRQSSVGWLAHMIGLAHFTAEAGKTYYFRARTSLGENAVEFLDINPLDSDEGRYLVASYPLSVSHPHK